MDLLHGFFRNGLFRMVDLIIKEATVLVRKMGLRPFNYTTVFFCG